MHSAPPHDAKSDTLVLMQKVRLAKKDSFILTIKPRSLFRIMKISSSAPCKDFVYIKPRVGSVLVFPKAPQGEVDGFDHSRSFYPVVLTPLDEITVEVRYTGRVHRPPPPAEILLSVVIDGERVPSSVTQRRRWISQAK